MPGICASLLETVKLRAKKKMYFGYILLQILPVAEKTGVMVTLQYVLLVVHKFFEETYKNRHPPPLPPPGNLRLPTDTGHGQHVSEAYEPTESEGEQPIKPSGQHRTWLGLLNSQTGEETQWNTNKLDIARILYGDAHHSYFYYNYYYYYYYYYYYCC